MGTKRFRVAVSGTSADWGTEKRTIEADHLIEMAKNYDPVLYTALLWDEHIKGWWSKESEFKAMGEVISLETEIFEVRGEQRTALYAEVKPYKTLLSAIEDGFNKFFSIEIDKNFSDFKSSYLTGLGLVGEPGSIGTEMALFSKNNNDRELFIGESIEFVSEKHNEESTLFKRINSMFKRDKPEDIEKSVEALATHFKNNFEAHNAEFTSLKTENESIKVELNKTNEALTELTDKFAKLTALVDQIPAPQERKPHEGDPEDTSNLTDY